METKSGLGDIIVMVALILFAVILVDERWIRTAIAFVPAMLLAQRAVGVRVQQVPDVPKKPDPAAAFAIAAALAVDPAECWLVGDSGVDMQTAVGAGMKAIGVLWGFRGEAELREHGAELLLAHPSELLTHILSFSETNPHPSKVDSR